MFEGTQGQRIAVEPSASVVWYRGAIRRHTLAEMVVVALARIGVGTRAEVAASCVALYPSTFAMTVESRTAALRVSVAFVRTGSPVRKGWVRIVGDGRFEITARGREHAAKVAAQIESDRRG